MVECNIGLTGDELQKLISVLSSQKNIEKAIIYGSRAKGTNRKFSDVGSNLTHRDLNVVALSVDDLLLPYEFDISLYSALKNKKLLEHIDRVGKVIYTNHNS